jgi:hypothetical protein
MTVNPADSAIFADLFGTVAMRELFTAHLDPATLARLMEPANYVGEAHAVVDRVQGRARDVLGMGAESAYVEGSERQNRKDAS